MRVIFQADVKGVAKAGDIKEVKDGYARNFLIPKGFAVEATSGRERALNDKKQHERKKQEKDRQEMQRLAEELKDLSLVIRAKAGDGGRLFGAVTNADVAKALGNLGHPVDRKKISMEDLKHVGQGRATLHLYAGITAEITIVVEAES